MNHAIISALVCHIDRTCIGALVMGFAHAAKNN